jgi:hypothetical protein
MPPRHRPFADHPCATQHPELIKRAQTFLALSIGDSTRRTYSTGVSSYLTFVEEHHLPTAFPASIPTLCLWMTALASPPRPVTLGTCKVYLSAVVNRHAEMGLPNPLLDAAATLDRVLAGIKRATSHTSRPKLPITTAMLRSMRPHLDLHQRRDSLVWAMMWTATAGLLRISEFAIKSTTDTDRMLRMSQLRLFDHAHRSYTLQQIAACSNRPALRYAILHLEASKTDPLRVGVDQVISAPAALVALCDYATLCHPTMLTATTPLFHFLDGTAIHRSWLMQKVERLLHIAGHDPRLYSSHSFRKGGAVSLQEAGVEDSIIRRSGRWKSDAFHLYVRHATIDSLVSANARL